MSAPTQSQLFSPNSRPTQQEFDVIVIGSGIGGLVTATQLAAKKAKVLVLESYTIPGVALDISIEKATDSMSAPP